MIRDVRVERNELFGEGRVVKIRICNIKTQKTEIMCKQPLMKSYKNTTYIGEERDKRHIANTTYIIIAHTE